MSAGIYRLELPAMTAAERERIRRACIERVSSMQTRCSTWRTTGSSRSDQKDRPDPIRAGRGASLQV
jgi:hypothetical protein